jgi:2,4-dienoyl-CoA reductase (NADPH2)
MTPELADRALGEGIADLAAMGRAILADPAWARKALAGQADTIHRCQECKVCHHFRHAENCPARKELKA